VGAERRAARRAAHNTQTSTVQLPSWLEAGSRRAIDAASAFYNQPFQPFTGQRVAPVSTDIQSGIEELRDLNSTPPNAMYGDIADRFRALAGGSPLYGEAAALYRQGGQPISTERIVDEGGQLGQISDYTSPYTQATLDPALREMERVNSVERNRMGGLRGGAYGDARHGVLEAEQERNYTTAVGDVTSRAYSDAWNQAMGLRGSDLERFLGVDMANRDASMASAAGLAGVGGAQQAAEQAGAQGLAGVAQAQSAEAANAFNQEMARIQSLLQAGTLTQANAQAELDAAYEAYLMKQQDQYDRLAALVGAAGGVPYGRTETTVGPTGYPMMQLLGSALGSFVGR
jgi:hypothetical protein